METFTHQLPNRPRRAWLAMVLLCCALTGCTAMTNPVADGIPVRLLPDELIGPCKTSWQTIPLNALRQPPTDAYRLATGDVLGVFIDGYVGASTQPLPVQAASPVLVRDQNRLAPAAGYPITVQEDGQIALPSVPKLKVDGMTVGEARDAIRDLYIKKELLKPDNERILVSLLYPRQSQVLVFRQEATAFQAAQDGPIPISKRNTGHIVDLPAYENDVLHALARTGGLPDLDAYNEIIIYRDYLRNKNVKVELNQLEKGKPGAKQQDVWVGETVRIPLRLPPAAPLPFSKNDVVLHTGDVVFLEARDEQVFFTGGLLPPGKHMLPRDHDLDVLEAVAMVRGPLYNGAWGGSNLSGQLIQPGLGSPSPSLVVVLRRVPGRGQVPIAVDLRSALQHPQERIPIRPGDVLLLQEKPGEAFARYFTQTFLNFEMMLNVFNSSRGFGVLDVAGPDRLSTQPGTFTNVLP
jgi:protein involved in polysaccharide export with SLBB domain